MVTCSALGCVNRSDRRYCRGVTFHKFPSDPLRREIWVQAVKRGEWQPALRSVLCSAHFEEEDFDRSSTLSVRLKPTAVPSIFPDPTIKSRKSLKLREPVASNQEEYFSLSARLCEISAGLEQKEDEIVQENSKKCAEIKGKQPDIIPAKVVCEKVDPPFTILKIPQTKHKKSSKALMPHKFLEIQLEENENCKPDILSRVLKCNKNLTLKVSKIPSNTNSTIPIGNKIPNNTYNTFSSTKIPHNVTSTFIAGKIPNKPKSTRAVTKVPSNVGNVITAANIPNSTDYTITASKISRNTVNTIPAAKIPRICPKTSENNESVKKPLTPMPHDFLEIQLTVFEEQPPEGVKLFLNSNEISIKKVSPVQSETQSKMVIEPDLPLYMKNFKKEAKPWKPVNQT